MNSQLVELEPETLEYLPAQTLLRLVQSTQRANKNLKGFRHTVREHSDLFRQLEGLEIEPGFYADNEYITLSFTGDGEKLKTVWGLLRRAGFSTSIRPKKGDTAFNAFWHQEGLMDLFMCFSSNLCKRVKVGTKMVEQDVFETQCGEMPEVEAEAPSADVVEVDDVPF